MRNLKGILKIFICAALIVPVALAGACISLNPGDSGGTGGVAPVVFLLRISVAVPPEKLNYTAGESFEPDGMSVMAHYSNGTKQQVEDYAFSPGGTLSAKDREIVISFQDKFVKQKITVTSGVSYTAFIDGGYDFSGLEKTAYEAEGAFVPGRILTGDRKNYPDTTKLNGASGGAWLGNTGFANNWIEFAVLSETDTDAVFELVLACSFFWVYESVRGGNIPMENLGRFIDMTVDGCPVDLTNIRLAPGTHHADDALNTAWTNWKSLIIEGIELTEGENILRIEVKALLDEDGQVMKDPVWNSPVYRCPSLDVLNVWTV